MYLLNFLNNQKNGFLVKIRINLLITVTLTYSQNGDNYPINFIIIK